MDKVTPGSTAEPFQSKGVFTLGDARVVFWADVKNYTIRFNVKF